MKAEEFTSNARSVLLRDIRNGKMNLEEVIVTQTTITIDKSNTSDGTWRYYFDGRIVDSMLPETAKEIEEMWEQVPQSSFEV